MLLDHRHALWWELPVEEVPELAHDGVAVDHLLDDDGS